jgi:hypothetical protein
MTMDFDKWFGYTFGTRQFNTLEEAIIPLLTKSYEAGYTQGHKAGFEEAGCNEECIYCNG